MIGMLVNFVFHNLVVQSSQPAVATVLESNNEKNMLCYMLTFIVLLQPKFFNAIHLLYFKVFLPMN